jgi:hypothetical protein
LISSFPAVQDHKDILSGDLKISDSRLAYIGRLEGSVCAWFPILEELESVKGLLLVFSEKDSLYLCVPVEREQYEVEPKLKLSQASKSSKILKSNRRTRVQSVSDIKESKRPRSGTRSIKKEEIKKEEVDSEHDLEFDDDELFGVKKEEEVQECNVPRSRDLDIEAIFLR